MDEKLLANLNGLSNQSFGRAEILRLPFGYPGSKIRSLEQILPEIPYRKTYIEPFGGSGAVLLARHQSVFEVFNDRCAGVTALYRVIRDKRLLTQFLERMELTLHSREEWVWSHDTWKNCEDDVERAARWYYMILMSFNQKGKYFGRGTKWRAQMAPKLHNNLLLFGGLHNRLRDVQIENQDFRQMFMDYDSEEVVWYLDPSYLPGFVTSGFYNHELKRAEHVELLDRIFGRSGYPGLQGFVALSSYCNPLYDSYPWKRVKKWRVTEKVLGQMFCDENHLAGKGDGMKRGYVEECLYLKE